MRLTRGAERDRRQASKRMRCYLLTGAVVAFATAGCVASEVGSSQGATDLIEVVSDDTSEAWDGLEKPTSVKVAPDGSVHVADNGDGRMHVFDRDGRPLRAFGRIGDGPGEYRSLRTFTVSISGVRLFDATPTRFVLFSTRGTDPRTRPYPGSVDDQVAALGDASLVLASSARWSAPVRPGTPPWPLAQIVDSQGVVVANVGEREVVASPFAGHIRNFVWPAGSRDGSVVWLAYLNSADIVLYTTANQSTQRISRTLPFEWQRLASDFIPKMVPPEPGQPTIPPFDVISYGIDTDSDGRAFILTAAESIVLARREPVAMAVDVIDPQFPDSLRRLHLQGHHTHLAVTPSGDRLYLLNATTGVIRMFEVPE